MHSRQSFLKGAIQGAELGVHSGSRVVEGVHAAVQDSVRRRVPVSVPGPGVTGAVYGAIRSLTTLLAVAGTRGLDWAGGDADPDSRELQPWQLHCASAFNAAWGDFFHAQNHHWALPMGFACGERPASFTAGVPSWLSASPSPHLVVFVHGLGMNELAWQNPEGASLPERLSQDFDCQVLYLRYNTGRAIHDNGADLAQRLEQLINEYPVPVESMTLVGHSMGGLVGLSAGHQGLDAGHGWTQRLRGQVCLGAPHQGAKLETMGNWLTHFLNYSSYSAPLALIGQWRSAGIKDLRHGSLRADDWDERDRDDVAHFHPHPVDPVPGAHYLFVGTTLAGIRGGTLEKTVGDGLVTPWSALNPRLHAPAEDRIRCKRLDGIGHMGLLDHPAVADELVRWYGQQRRRDAVSAQGSR